MDYPGKVITKTQVTPTQTSASGNWTLDDQAAAIKNNNWPVALVPNPISKSLRFNSADSAYLNRTPASASNRKTWTWSGWIKKSSLTTYDTIFMAGASAGDCVALLLYNDGTFGVYSNGVVLRQTTQVFRDPSAWYHFVVAMDTTQATANNRVKVYVNGSEITAFGTTNNPTQNADLAINNTTVHYTGFQTASLGFSYYNGYLTETNFIDGQALTPSSFGMTNPQTGQWIPKKYSGTYGTNGFYLNFKDATSTTTLGYDYSGNANNWTTNNFSVTAGAGNDSLTDVPTPWVAYNTTGDVGGVIRGNYCTPNPLDTNSALLFANGNLDLSNSSGVGVSCRSTFQMPSGKWYWEFTVGTAGTYVGGGIGTSAATTGSYTGDSGTSYGYLSHTGNKYNSGSASAYGATFTNGDVIGISFDADAGTLIFYKNGSSQGTAFSSLTGGTYFPMFSARSGSISVNFGQRPFAYTPPTGFRSLCTTNLPATAIGFGLTNQGDDYFNAVLYTGNGSTQSITGVGFQPDWVWVKSRSSAGQHSLTDVVRGVNKQLFTSLTNAEGSQTDQVTAFNSDGFSLGANVAGTGSVNVNTLTYVAWNWKAGGTGVTNTAGSITSTVSANTTAGFSVVTYTGNGTLQQTVGHGIGIAPQMIILKRRNGSNATFDNWWVYHIGTTFAPNRALALNNSDAEVGSTTFWWNNPTSTVFGLANTPDATYTNANTGTYVAYCFAPVAGYSAFGSYAGNGSADGPFVYLGFRPAFVMLKAYIGSGENWAIYDKSRIGYNSSNYVLFPNLTNAENAATTHIDLLSNGFKLRSGNQNLSGYSYIYAAFAESPFQFANAR